MKACIPSENIHKQRPCRTFHRLDLDPGFGSHGGVGLFHWVEVQNCGDDLVGNGLASSKERAKAVDGSVDKNSITGDIASGRNTQAMYIMVRTRRPR